MAEASAARGRRVLTAAWLVDGSGAPAVADPAVTLLGDRIVAVEARSPDWRPPLDAEVRELGRATILPGLIDTHVHLGFVPLGHPLRRPAVLRDAAARAEAALASGVTLVRDLGSVAGAAIEVRDRCADGGQRGPRILAADVPVTSPGGHLHWFGAVADDTASLERAVDRVHAAGADVVKLMATGGMSTPGSSPDRPQFEPALVEVVTRRAHRLGLSVAAHALCTAGVLAAVTGGVDTVEHGWTITGGPQDFDDAIVPRLVAAGTPFSVTAHESLRALLRAGTEAALLELRRRLRPHRTLYEAGVPMVVHSDAGVGETRIDGFAESVSVLAAGFEIDPVLAIRAATSVPARALGLGDHLGLVRPGYLADLLVVDGDAAADIGALTRVCAVVLGGREVLSGSGSGQALGRLRPAAVWIPEARRR